MAFSVLLGAFCALQLWEGSSAVTTVFVQKGNDLRLDVQEHVKLEEGDSFKWRFNNSINVVRLFYNNNPIINPTYKGRADVSPQNHSLILKNVQQSDSGDYTAVISGDKEQRVAEYKVIIQDPVSPVDVTVKSVSTSTESCNLTVSCTTQDSHIHSTLRCDNQSCKQEGGERSETTTSGSSLRIYLLNDSIICNHSNQVSWTTDLREIRPLCPIKSVTNGSTATNVWIWIVVFCLLALCVVALVFGLYTAVRKNKRKHSENTVNEIPQVSNTVLFFFYITIPTFKLSN
ncbi:hypothetical protein PAMA_004714 [Pampus argenteus]